MIPKNYSEEILMRANILLKMYEQEFDLHINFEQYNLILKYLQDLDLLENYSEYYEKYSQGEIQIYTYPAMINAIPVANHPNNCP